MLKLLKNDKNLLKVLEPYLPALSRNEDIIKEFVEKIQEKQDWADVDVLMYAKMNDDERDILSSAILSEARKTVDSIYNFQEISKKILIKLVEYAIKMYL